VLVDGIAIQRQGTRLVGIPLMSDSEMDRALWDMANAITAFAIVQTIAFVYVTLQREAGKALATRFAVSWIRRLTPIFAMGYVLTIWGCYWCRPTPGIHWAAWFFSSLGRSIVVVFMGSIPIISTLASRALPKAR